MNAPRTVTLAQARRPRLGWRVLRPARTAATWRNLTNLPDLPANGTLRGPVPSRLMVRKTATGTIGERASCLLRT
jgi:hypothetical protein